jgi:hypothetical protein
MTNAPTTDAKGRTARWFWLTASATFIAGALFHLYSLFAPDSSPPARHALFVAINLGVAWACWQKPRWFIWLFLPLLLQQLYSHGTDFARAWPSRIDWQSLVVLVGMPIVAVALWRSRFARRRG